MPEAQTKFKKILSSKITLFLLLLAFLWLSVNLVNIFYKKYKTGKEIENLKAQIGELEKNNQEISDLIDYFSSQSFLEKEAREKLNLKKQGEEVVILEPVKEQVATSHVSEDKSQEQQNSAPVSEKTESNFEKWWNYFFE